MSFSKYQQSLDDIRVSGRLHIYTYQYQTKKQEMINKNHQNDWYYYEKCNQNQNYCMTISMLRYDCHDRGRTVTTAHKSSIHSFEGAVANARIIITCLAKEAHTPSLNPQLELFFQARDHISAPSISSTILIAAWRGWGNRGGEVRVSGGRGREGVMPRVLGGRGRGGEGGG